MFKPHVTVAAVVVYENKFLMVEEKDKTTGNVVFNQPAGHLEEYETLEEASIRELKEETGYFLKPDHFLGVYQFTALSNGKTYVRFAYIYEPEMQPSGFGKLDDDIIATHWLTAEEIKEKPLRSPLVYECIEDYLAGVRTELSIIKST